MMLIFGMEHGSIVSVPDGYVSRTGIYFDWSRELRMRQLLLSLFTLLVLQLCQDFLW